MSEVKETMTSTEVQELNRRGHKIPDHLAVIRPKKASVLRVRGLGVFEMDNPIHTNDLDFAARCAENGNLEVTTAKPLAELIADAKASKTSAAAAKTNK